MWILIQQVWGGAPDSAFLIRPPDDVHSDLQQHKSSEEAEKGNFTEPLNYHKSFDVKILQI